MLSLVARELLSSRHLTPATCAHAMASLGEQALVEAVGIIGYYALTAYTLNAFDMRLN
jgi:4-carboxymuconolactone decarboxylase